MVVAAVLFFLCWSLFRLQSEKVTNRLMVRTRAITADRAALKEVTA
jgi:hypothetical protein